MPMEPGLLEVLLNEDESATLDFKQEQYPFVNATVGEKAELLKDILAMANAWRRTGAYILIGVQDAQGGRSKIVGVKQHLAEAETTRFHLARTAPLQSECVVCTPN